MRIDNERGVALMIVMMLFLVASLGLSSMGKLGASHVRNVAHSAESTQAFYLMEAAVEEAKLALRNDFTGTALGDSAETNFDNGKYYFNIADDPAGDPTIKIITGYGALPNFDDADTARAVEVVISDPSALIPANFGDYAIWTASTLTTNGNSYTVTGSTISGAGYNVMHDRVSGTMDTDASISPLFDMDYDALREIAEAQGHLYTAGTKTSEMVVPTDFYFTDPDPLVPGDLGVPNILYFETSGLTINTNLGGFIVAVGEVATDPDDTCNVAIDGNRTVEGVIYTRGSFTLNGGGNGKNVTGGVYCQNAVTLNGGVIVTHNAPYQDAIQGILTAEDMEVLSWNEIEMD